MRRWHLQGFVAACVALSGVLASAAFTAGDLAPRTIQVSVVADASAYLGVGANPATPHACFVDVTNGKLSLDFDATTSGCTFNGGGLGINGGDGSDASKYGRYAFHDILRVKNQGVKTALVWVNATTTSAGGSALTIAGKTSPGAMTEADYSGAVGPFTLAPGSSAYVGVRVLSGTLQSASFVTGTLTFEGRK